jgi:NTP pyrophosphatase (non-canonical NTP hydrolase)
MRLSEYQFDATKTSIYPDAGLCTPIALAYTSLGLAGEAGEVANKAKKILRDGDSQELRDAIAGELGDVMWYLAAVANELHVSLEDIGIANLNKLSDRKARNTLQGNGDNR